MGGFKLTLGGLKDLDRSLHFFGCVVIGESVGASGLRLAHTTCLDSCMQVKQGNRFRP